MNKLISWNFATTVVHQHANRSRANLRTRQFWQNRGLLLLTKLYIHLYLNIALCVGKAALKDTEATSSKAFAPPLLVQYPSGLKK
uniref:Uncharacterized protein n=1 Tax=Sphingobacterium sp. (strain 21) TaxID=743722 RepID=F4CAC7_SPHS2